MAVLPGEATADGGAGKYRIPIELPEGAANTTPTVSLQYSSRLGNGPLGVGWNLFAGGSVHRCPFILDGDGLSREVLYASDDRLCIDGIKLVLLSGDYGKNGSMYVPEINANLVVKLKDDINSQTSEFTTIDDVGTSNVYRTPVVPNGAPYPLSWLLTTSSKRNGQSTEYRYLNSGHGEVLLDGITYDETDNATGKTLTGAGHEIRFAYAQRDDLNSSYLARGEQRLMSLLSRISVGKTGAASPTTQLEYDLTYRTSLATGRSLLSSIQACQTLSPQIDCTLPTQFNWQNSKLTFALPYAILGIRQHESLAPPWHPGEKTPSLTTFFAGGDYNADGRRDLFIRSASGDVTVAMLQPGGKVLHEAAVPSGVVISPQYPATNGLEIRQLGAAEIIAGEHGKLAVLDWADDTFAPPTETAIPYAHDAVLVDATGHGQNDIVTGTREGNIFEVTVYRNLNSSGTQLAFGPGEVVAKLEESGDLHLDSSSRMDGAGRVVLVRDGENVVQLIRFTSDSAGHYIASQFSLTDIGVSSDAINRGFIFADINGDGLDDVLYTSQSGDWQVQMNESFHFGLPIDTHTRDPRSNVGKAGTMVLDVTSDGRAKVVYPARRIANFCLKGIDNDVICSEAIAQANPHMDLGIYEYDAIDFRLSSDGRYTPRVIDNLHLIGQANRSQPGDLFGDGYPYLLSPFDRGVANGWFKNDDGALVECPPKFTCGLHVAQRENIKRDDRSDAPIDLLVGVQPGPKYESRWTYYPLSNPARHLYSVPPLWSADRFIAPNRYYFTSSMYVVGEFSTRDPQASAEVRYDYGAGEYNTAGRGFDGFKWIIAHDLSHHTKTGSWFGQDGPYRGMRERTWTEDEADDENDYFHGSPGKQYLSFERTDLTCSGPKDNPVSIRYHCKPSKLPAFSVYTTP
jgi:Salmonella virulence plasmid 65kDa B protein